MELHVVVQMVDGFARGDGATPTVVGAFTNREVAAQVRVLAGPRAQLGTVILDRVPEGMVASARDLGLDWFPPEAEADPVADAPAPAPAHRHRRPR